MQCRFLYDDIVTVLVGQDKRAFKIHKSILCRYSAFFKAALTNAFIEASTLSISLPTQDAEVFRHFVCWLYTNSIHNHTTHPDRTPRATSKVWLDLIKAEYVARGLPQDSQLDDLSPSNQIRRGYEMNTYYTTPFDTLVELYLLAHYLQAAFLQDLIITKLIMLYSDKCPNAQNVGFHHRFWLVSRLPPARRPVELPYPGPAINKAWSQLPESVPLCRVLVHIYCDHCMTADETMPPKDEGYTDPMETLHPTFIGACFKELQWRRTKGIGLTPWHNGKGICQWHVHGEGPCAGLGPKM